MNWILGGVYSKIYQQTGPKHWHWRFGCIVLALLMQFVIYTLYKTKLSIYTHPNKTFVHNNVPRNLWYFLGPFVPNNVSH